VLLGFDNEFVSLLEDSRFDGRDLMLSEEALRD